MKPPKAERLEGKLVKHSTPRLFSSKEVHRVLYVRGRTPFVSAVRHIEKMLDRLAQRNGRKAVESFGNTKYISVIGMGRAIEKVLSIGVYYQEEKLYRVEVYTRSVGVLDEFKLEQTRKNPEEHMSGKIQDEDVSMEQPKDLDDDEYYMESFAAALAAPQQEPQTMMKKRNVSAVEVRIWRR